MKRHGKWRWTVGGTTLLALTLATTPLFAETSGLTDQAIEALGHPAYAVREVAMRSLLANASIDPGQVAEAWPRAKSPEQRARLLDLGRHAVLRQLVTQSYPAEDEGAVGVVTREASRARARDGGVEVGATFPGFPAYAVLRSGDLITNAGGHPLAAPNAGERFRHVVKNQGAGARLPLTVLRGGEELKLTLQLAPLSALTDMYIRRGHTYELAAFAEQPWQAWLSTLEPDPHPKPFPSPRPLPARQ